MTVPATRPAPAAASLPAGALTVLAMAQLIIALDATIVFVALPEIGGALRFSAQQLQWVVSAYTVAFGGFLLLGGRATDLLGRRRIYVLGQALYALASLAGGVATDQALLIAARALQGIGGAMLFPATLALIHACFAEGPARTHAFAVWSAASAVGLALGSLLGGVLTEWLGWQAIFLVNVPLAGGCALAALRCLPADGPPLRGRRFDVAGGLTVTAGGTLLVLALVQGPETGWDAPGIIGSIVLACALLAAFVAIERHSPDPLVPLRMFGHRKLRLAMLLTCVFMASFGAQYYFLALYYQEVYRYSVLQAGLAFLPPTVLCTAGIHCAERMLLRAGERATLLAGLLAGAAGTAWLCLALPGGAGYWRLLAPIMLLSVGQGMTWTAMWVTAGSGVAVHEQGVASGMASMSQQVGGALALAVLVAVANAGSAGLDGEALRQAQAHGIERAFWGMAGVLLLGVAIAARLRRPAPLRGGTAAG